MAYENQLTDVNELDELGKEFGDLLDEGHLGVEPDDLDTFNAFEEETRDLEEEKEARPEASGAGDVDEQDAALAEVEKFLRELGREELPEKNRLQAELIQTLEKARQFVTALQSTEGSDREHRRQILQARITELEEQMADLQQRLEAHRKELRELEL